MFKFLFLLPTLLLLTVKGSPIAKSTQEHNDFSYEESGYPESLGSFYFPPTGNPRQPFSNYIPFPLIFPSGIADSSSVDLKKHDPSSSNLFNLPSRIIDPEWWPTWMEQSHPSRFILQKGSRDSNKKLDNIGKETNDPEIESSEKGAAVDLLPEITETSATTELIATNQPEQISSPQEANDQIQKDVKNAEEEVNKSSPEILVIVTSDNDPKTEESKPESIDTVGVEEKEVKYETESELEDRTKNSKVPEENINLGGIASENPEAASSEIIQMNAPISSSERDFPERTLDSLRDNISKRVLETASNNPNYIDRGILSLKESQTSSENDNEEYVEGIKGKESNFSAMSVLEEENQEIGSKDQNKNAKDSLDANKEEVSESNYEEAKDTPSSKVAEAIDYDKPSEDQTRYIGVYHDLEVNEPVKKDDQVFSPLIEESPAEDAGFVENNESKPAEGSNDEISKRKWGDIEKTDEESIFSIVKGEDHTKDIIVDSRLDVDDSERKEIMNSSEKTSEQSLDLEHGVRNEDNSNSPEEIKGLEKENAEGEMLIELTEEGENQAKVFNLGSEVNDKEKQDLEELADGQELEIKHVDKEQTDTLDESNAVIERKVLPIYDVTESYETNPGNEQIPEEEKAENGKEVLDLLGIDSTKQENSNAEPGNEKNWLKTNAKEGFITEKAAIDKSESKLENLGDEISNENRFAEPDQIELKDASPSDDTEKVIDSSENITEAYIYGNNDAGEIPKSTTEYQNSNERPSELSDHDSESQPPTIDRSLGIENYEANSEKHENIKNTETSSKENNYEASTIISEPRENTRESDLVKPSSEKDGNIKMEEDIKGISEAYQEPIIENNLRNERTIEVEINISNANKKVEEAITAPAEEVHVYDEEEHNSETSTQHPSESDHIIFGHEEEYHDDEEVSHGPEYDIHEEHHEEEVFHLEIPDSLLPIRNMTQESLEDDVYHYNDDEYSEETTEEYEATNAEEGEEEHEDMERTEEVTKVEVRVPISEFDSENRSTNLELENRNTEDSKIKYPEGLLPENSGSQLS